jgi:hypothetical protein
MKEDPESKKKNSDFDAIQTKFDSAEQCNAQPKGTTQIQKNQQRKSTQYIWDQKPSFLLQFTQVINQFMKVAALPPSFDSKLKMCSLAHVYSRYYENKIQKWQGAPTI